MDIDAETWCLDPALIESAITPRTRAIVPVHVFGNACKVEEIARIAHRHNLKVVYDGCHAFGVNYKGESLLKHGDAATLSFHATKLFHTVEGGAIIFKRKVDLERARKMINFGITGPETIEEIGINAKMNEFQAAMGLCVLDEIEENLESRRMVWEAYREALGSGVVWQKRQPHSSNNYAYVPIVLSSENELKAVVEKLNAKEIVPRRYFYPALQRVDSYKQGACPVSADIASRILCLPLYSNLSQEKISEIADSMEK